MEDYGLAHQWILALHSYFAYVVLAVLFLAVANGILGWTGNKDFTLRKDFRISLFALILSHLQLLVGLVLYFVSSNGLNAIKTLGMGGLEHPFINIIAVVFITVGWSKHKKVLEGKRKFKTITIFYGLGLILILSRIPWAQWLN